MIARDTWGDFFSIITSQNEEGIKKEKSGFVKWNTRFYSVPLILFPPLGKGGHN
jgi:hypothetical protein